MGSIRMLICSRFNTLLELVLCRSRSDDNLKIGSLPIDCEMGELWLEQEGKGQRSRHVAAEQ